MTGFTRFDQILPWKTVEEVVWLFLELFEWMMEFLFKNLKSNSKMAMRWVKRCHDYRGVYLFVKMSATSMFSGSFVYL